jgi:hypothetical protein
MGEPIGILSGTLTLLEAARQLYQFIEKVADAPDVITSAKADFHMMVEVLEDLKQHASLRTGKPTAQDVSMAFVLQSCLEKCMELQTLLSDLVHHSSSGKLSIRDRTRVALKKNDIDDLRRDISSGRESLAVALGSLNL